MAKQFLEKFRLKRQDQENLEQQIKKVINN